MSAVPDEITARLKAAFQRNELTLFVGAGASVESGMPTWPDLLKAVFINSLGSVRTGDDALQATARIWFDALELPPDVVARLLRGAFASPDEFLTWVRFALYGWLDCKPSGLPTKRYVESLKENRTLSAIATLCERTRYRESGLRRVISYNFDNLLELRLGAVPHAPIWMAKKARPDRLPVYHVHGYLPARQPWAPYPRGSASSGDQLVLTEDQYHAEAASPYSWSNLTQLNAISDSVGLTVGLSMTDPNMRRILDISARTTGFPEIFALLARPSPPAVSEQQVLAIVDLYNRLSSRNYFGEPTGHQPTSNSRAFAARCNTIWAKLEDLAQRRQVTLMKELGVIPVWCEHQELPDLFDAISA